LYIVDKTITTLESRFEQFKTYEDIYVFLFSVKKLKSPDCTNVYIAYRIMLTIPASFVSCKMSFSNIKIIKTYLRSTRDVKKIVLANKTCNG